MSLNYSSITLSHSKYTCTSKVKNENKLMKKQQHRIEIQCRELQTTKIIKKTAKLYFLAKPTHLRMSQEWQYTCTPDILSNKSIPTTRTDTILEENNDDCGDDRKLKETTTPYRQTEKLATYLLPLVNTNTVNSLNNLEVTNVLLMRQLQSNKQTKNECIDMI